MVNFRLKHSIPLCNIAVVAALMTACSIDDNSGDFFSLPDAKWHYGKVFTFNEQRDTLGEDIESVDLTIRHSGNYAYANLWVELSYTANDSVVADTFNIQLSDDYGKWVGSGAGPVKTRTETLPLRNVPDAWSSFGVRHIMRIDVLDDIEQVGLNVNHSHQPEKQ